MNRPGEARRTLAIGVGAVVSVLFIVFGGFQVVQATTWSTQRHSVEFGQPVRHIEVDGGARVSIYGEPSNAVTVNSTISESIGHAKPQVYIVGDTLHLDGECNVLLVGWCSINYEVRLPAAVPLTVSSSSGRISAENMRADLSMRADDGALSVSNIKGSVTMTAASGRISADSVTGTSLQLEADSGRISASDISVRRFTARAASGQISADFKSDPMSVDAEADSGTIDIVVPGDNATYDVTRVSADSGTVDTGSVNSQPGAARKIVAHASSGRVSVESAN